MLTKQAKYPFICEENDDQTWRDINNYNLHAKRGVFTLKRVGYCFGSFLTG